VKYEKFSTVALAVPFSLSTVVGTGVQTSFVEPFHFRIVTFSAAFVLIESLIGTVIVALSNDVRFTTRTVDPTELVEF